MPQLLYFFKQFEPYSNMNKLCDQAKEKDFSCSLSFLENIKQNNKEFETLFKLRITKFTTIFESNFCLDYLAEIFQLKNLKKIKLIQLRYQSDKFFIYHSFLKGLLEMPSLRQIKIKSQGNILNQMYSARPIESQGA